VSYSHFTFSEKMPSQLLSKITSMVDKSVSIYSKNEQLLFRLSYCWTGNSLSRYIFLLSHAQPLIREERVLASENEGEGRIGETRAERKNFLLYESDVKLLKFKKLAYFSNGKKLWIECYSSFFKLFHKYEF